VCAKFKTLNPKNEENMKRYVTRETQTRRELSWGEAISMQAISGQTDQQTDQPTN
jgi:hypothetical protein